MATGTGSIIISDSRLQDKQINEGYNAAQNVKLWFTFDEQKGLITRRTDGNSKWSTLVNDQGFYINNDDVGYVEAFYKEEAHFRSIKVTKKAGQQSTDIRVRPTATGGWVWSD